MKKRSSPPLKTGESLIAEEITAQQKFTQQPPRYTEATLVKKLEELGIGRPSTYAPTISTIQKREYVEQIDRRFHATMLGSIVTDKLIQAFPDVMDVQFTAGMELQLDQIEPDTQVIGIDEGQFFDMALVEAVNERLLLDVVKRLKESRFRLVLGDGVSALMARHFAYLLINGELPTKQQRETFESLRFSMAVALMLVYMVLASQFRSLLDRQHQYCRWHAPWYALQALSTRH